MLCASFCWVLDVVASQVLHPEASKMKKKNISDTSLRTLAHIAAQVPSLHCRPGDGVPRLLPRHVG